VKLNTGLLLPLVALPQNNYEIAVKLPKLAIIAVNCGKLEAFPSTANNIFISPQDKPAGIWTMDGLFVFPEIISW
jgi:hypothetical protein